MSSRFDILVSSDSDDDEAHKLSPEAQTEIESLGFIYGEDLSVRGRDLTFKIRLDHEGGPLVWDLEITRQNADLVVAILQDIRHGNIFGLIS